MRARRNFAETASGTEGTPGVDKGAPEAPTRNPGGAGASCASCGKPSVGRKDLFGRDVCNKCLSLTPPTGERVGPDAGAGAPPPEPEAASPSVGPDQVVQPVASELVLRAVRGLAETEQGATPDRVRQQAAAYGAGGEAVDLELRYLLEMGRLRLDPDGRLREGGG